MAPINWSVASIEVLEYLLFGLAGLGSQERARRYRSKGAGVQFQVSLRHLWASGLAYQGLFCFLSFESVHNSVLYHLLLIRLRSLTEKAGQLG